MSVWFITGTTSGFGTRLVTSALERGDRVIATGRSEEKLKALEKTIDPKYHENLRTLQLDVTEGLESLKAKAERAAGFWGSIDVLINNAGSALPALLEEAGSALLRQQFDINVFGVMDVTTAVLPYLRASKAATLVVIGSYSAWKTEFPGVGVARSSKAAIHALTETLALELAPFNIRVLLVAPGFFRHEGIQAVKYYTGNPIPAYDPIRNAHLKLFESLGGAEKLGSDSDKAMERIVDVVRGEGLAKGREWPLYLLLGEDAVLQSRLHCTELLEVLDKWGDVATSVGYDADD